MADRPKKFRRLKQSLIPTRLVSDGERQPIKILPVKNSKVPRALTVLVHLLLFGLQMTWMRITRRLSAIEGATRLRVFLEDLGGLWVKAGQLISLRIDLLSPEMVQELTQLQYRAYGFTTQISRKIVQDTIGRPLEEVFDVFEDLPFAAASISQVHRAHLRHEDIWVAIKVKRPGIKSLFERDIKLITSLIKTIGRIPAVSFIAWDGMIRELNQIMREELDYRYEMGNLRRMRKILRPHKIYVPKLFIDYSGPDVIVMEMIEGLLMSDYLRIIKTNPERITAWCQENNVNTEKVGSLLMRSFYRQLFEDNLFHGDLHPGNIILLRNSHVALIDLGTVGNLEVRFVANYKAQAVAVIEQDYANAADLYLLMSDSIPPMDLSSYRAEMVELYRGWEARSHMQGLSYLERSISGGVASDVSAIARKYKINPSWQFLRVGRALSTLDANLNQLLGKKNPNKILARYLRESQQRALRSVPRNLVSSVSRTLAGASEAANYLSDTLRRQAIQFQGGLTIVARIFSVFFTVVRWVLGIGFVVLVYDFIDLYYSNLTQGLENRLGAFDRLIDAIPPYDYEIGIAILVLIVLLFLISGSMKKYLAQPSPRLPSGKLDS